MNVDLIIGIAVGVGCLFWIIYNRVVNHTEYKDGIDL